MSLPPAPSRCPLHTLHFHTLHPLSFYFSPVAALRKNEYNKNYSLFVGIIRTLGHSLRSVQCEVVTKHTSRNVMWTSGHVSLELGDNAVEVTM